MGGGAWINCAYVTHSTTRRGYTSMEEFYSASSQDLYRSRSLPDILNPKNVIRECRDSEEHPNTIPVILALDVTGSMGPAAEAVAKQLNDIMTEIYKIVNDVEFCIMAIGDLSYDCAPIQMGQFESDIRIAEQLEKVYFEKGGGGNRWESYTAAWYMGSRHTQLDCLNRNKKGIIITMGDEPLNPYLPARPLSIATGDNLQADIDTKELYEETITKFDIYHIGIDDRNTSFKLNEKDINNSFGQLLGENYMVCTCQNLYKTIASIIEKYKEANFSSGDGGKNEIYW